MLPGPSAARSRCTFLMRDRVLGRFAAADGHREFLHLSLSNGSIPALILPFPPSRLSRQPLPHASHPRSMTMLVTCRHNLAFFSLRRQPSFTVKLMLAFTPPVRNAIPASLVNCICKTMLDNLWSSPFGQRHINITVIGSVHRLSRHGTRCFCNREENDRRAHSKGFGF